MKRSVECPSDQTLPSVSYPVFDLETCRRSYQLRNRQSDGFSITKQGRGLDRKRMFINMVRSIFLATLERPGLDFERIRRIERRRGQRFRESKVESAGTRANADGNAQRDVGSTNPI